MNIIGSDQFKNNCSFEMSNKLSENDVAPHFAMKEALQSMKDRCAKLQTRISRLEEENLHLRIGKRQQSEDNNIGINNADFEKKIEELKSKLTCGTSTTQLLNDKNDSFNKFQTISSDSKSEDFSLEEVSLKVLNTILQRRTNLETPSPKAGNELKSVEESDTSAEEEDTNFNSMNVILQEILGNIKRDRDLVKKQREGLRAALQIFKKVLKENVPCKTCAQRESMKAVENKIVGTEESLRGGVVDCGLRPVMNHQQHYEPGLKDRICPLCGQYFDCDTPFDTFNQHVLDHFVEVDDESTDFELVT